MLTAQTTPGGETMGAELSDDGVYRYHLWRIWGAAPRVLWVCLNPSTADALKDDATVRRIRNFSKAFGYGGFDLANLYAFRATSPRDLVRASAPIGPENDRHLKTLAENAPAVIVAWGTNAKHGLERMRHVLRLLRTATAAKSARRSDVHCMRVTKEGHPEHPLRLPAHLQTVIYDQFPDGFRP